MLINGVDDVLHFGGLLSIAIRWAVSRFPYSGAGKPPIYGDYEAQRHWMEITVNLPAHKWYENSTVNDLQYWGLDYPPLTAYHSLLCGYLANWINPEWVALFSSRGHESYYHKIFMRSTVLASDIIFYTAVILYWTTISRPHKLRDKFVVFMSCEQLNYANVEFYRTVFILSGLGWLIKSIDAVNQLSYAYSIRQLLKGIYNSVSLGLTLLAVVCLMKKRDLSGAMFFTLALHFKQMALYYAFPFFCYLLGTCFRLPRTKGVIKFLQLGIVVMITSAICWMPFLTSYHTASQVVHRLFPLARGIFEDKVANVWCVLSIFIKFKDIFTTSTLAIICAFSTLLVNVPSSFHLVQNPSLHNFRLALVNSSLAFFLFSYQVHEKSILFPALPVLLLLEDHPLACIWFSCISTYSLVPLLAKDGLIIPFVSMTVLFLVGAIRAYEQLLLSFKTKKDAIASLMFCLSLSGGLILTICMFTVKQPARLPHLHILLNCVYSVIHFVGFAIYFNILQYTEVPLTLVSPKPKYL